MLQKGELMYETVSPSSTFTTSLAVHFWADRVLWLESLSDPKLSLLDLAATGPKVLFGLCSLEAPPLESAVGRGGPGGRRGPGSESPLPAVRRESLVGPWGRAAPVDGEASAAAAVVGTGAVERSRLALVVCGGLWVVAGGGALGDAGWEGAGVSVSNETTGVFSRSGAYVARFSFLLQDSQQSLLYPGMEQYRARTSIWQKIDLSPRHGSSSDNKGEDITNRIERKKHLYCRFLRLDWFLKQMTYWLTWREFVDRVFRSPLVYSFVFYCGVFHCFNGERRHWLSWSGGQNQA